MCNLLQPDVADPAWVVDVTRFWFEEYTWAEWFAKSDDIDSQIRDRFLALQIRLVLEDGLGVTLPRSILAAVVVLDQMSRNMFRGDRRAYSGDNLARRLAQSALDGGFDISMTREERLFLYLPFEHSEFGEDQARSVELISCLGVEDWTRDALLHKQIIDRFGRFPHRNAILGRASTADEIAHLREQINSFEG